MGRRNPAKLRLGPLIGLIALAFTIISAGIGLVQARFSVLTAIYGILNSPGKLNATEIQGLVAALNRLNQQSELDYPLGVFLIVSGLSILFATITRFMLAVFLEKEQTQPRTLSKRRMIMYGAAIGGSFALIGISYFTSSQVNSTVTNLAAKLSSHLSFSVGFVGLSLIVLVVIDFAWLRGWFHSDSSD